MISWIVLKNLFLSDMLLTRGHIQQDLSYMKHLKQFKMWEQSRQTRERLLPEAVEEACGELLFSDSAIVITQSNEQKCAAHPSVGSLVIRCCVGRE